MGPFRLVLLILCTVICPCWGEESTQRCLSGIALEIIKANPDKNVVLAPFAFRFPLCRLAAAATGNTKQELMTVLRINDTEEIKNCFVSIYTDVGRLMESDMTFLNMIYVNYTNDIDGQFISDSPDFGVTVSKIGFHYPQASVGFVNNEFESKTYKRIKDVLEPKDIDGDSSILLVNGMHFKASWESSFNVNHTEKKVFHRHGNETAEVFLMNGIQQCLYLDNESERYKAISLKLANHGVSIMFLLPDETISMEQFLASVQLTPEALQKITKKMKWDSVNVFLPRFKIKTSMDWTGYFKQFGLNRTTTANSDFNAIFTKDAKSSMHLSKAKQKVFLDIDEMGTHRQNVRDEFDLRNQEGSPELPDTAYDSLLEFLADRPFVFIISMVPWRSTEFEIINGVYYGPE